MTASGRNAAPSLDPIELPTGSLFAYHYLPG